MIKLQFFCDHSAFIYKSFVTIVILPLHSFLFLMMPNTSVCINFRELRWPEVIISIRTLCHFVTDFVFFVILWSVLCILKSLAKPSTVYTYLHCIFHIGPYIYSCFLNIFCFHIKGLEYCIFLGLEIHWKTEKIVKTVNLDNFTCLW